MILLKYHKNEILYGFIKEKYHLEIVDIQNDTNETRKIVRANLHL